MAVQGVLFDKRFLESFAGHNILRSPRTAIVELVANAWDAGATRVDIAWPERDSGKTFAIKDNGGGMTEAEFRHRWRRMAYDRLREQGPTVEVHSDRKLPPRTVFGRNGIGRFAGFYFADEYFVETWRDGTSNTFRVLRGDAQPLTIDLMKSGAKSGRGTRVFVEECTNCGLSAEDVRAEIGLRFLTDPNFAVRVDRRLVAFTDIRNGQIKEYNLDVNGVGPVQLIAIDTLKTDRTTRQHGVAWRVKTRLVGDCSWKDHGREELIDGRRIAAKRFTFIIFADCLEKAVAKDWSGFEDNNEAFQKVAAVVYEKIDEFLTSVSDQDRRATLKKAREVNRDALNRLTIRQNEKWEKFVTQTHEACPSIGERELVTLSTVLANLEEAQSQYCLIHRLGELQPDQLDDLHQILADWTVDMAKVVLDEIRTRMLLIDELKRKVASKTTDEVQELQPLFKRGLWIFGPEFETIEYTANEGMTEVVNKLFCPEAEVKASRNRPDFAIVPDGSAGLFSYPKYDTESAAEIGIERLVIVELKRPGIPISTDQKAQCWKYIKELYSLGLLQPFSSVRCFALGSEVDPLELHPRKEMKEQVWIWPLSYDTVLDRAKARMLKLYERVKEAPFMKKKEIKDYLRAAEKQGGALQRKLFTEGTSDRSNGQKRKPR